MTTFLYFNYLINYYRSLRILCILAWFSHAWLHDIKCDDEVICDYLRENQPSSYF